MHPMNYERLALIWILVAACGGPKASNVDVEVEARVDRLDTSGLSAPVVAVGSDGERYLAAIDYEVGWPVFVDDDGTTSLFPGNPSPAPVDLAMVMGPQERLHAVWSGPVGVYYARMSPASPDDADVVYFGVSASSATLDVSSDGEVFIAFATSRYATIKDGYVTTVRGSVERGFEAPHRRMPDPNESRADHARFVSVRSVEYDRGSVRVSYSWSDDDGEWTSQVVESRTLDEIGRLRRTSTHTHHAVIRGPSGTGVLTTNPQTEGLVLRTFGGAARRLLPGRFSAVQAVTVDGVPHVLAIRAEEGRYVFDYVTSSGRGWRGRTLLELEEIGAVSTVARAGGIVVAAGRVYVPFEIWKGGGYQIAVFEAALPES